MAAAADWVSLRPRSRGILDQFIVEQPYDEREGSWHPKIALVAYNCPKGEIRWKLWIGSWNLTRSQDLDAGVLLDGSEKRAKGRVRLPGVDALGVALARSASREDADDIAAQLEAIWWDAPAGFRLRSLLNGLDDGVPLPAEPPAGAVDGITIISPFLSPDFLKNDNEQKLERAGAPPTGLECETASHRCAVLFYWKRPFPPRACDASTFAPTQRLIDVDFGFNMRLERGSRRDFRFHLRLKSIRPVRAAYSGAGRSASALEWHDHSAHQR